MKNLKRLLAIVIGSWILYSCSKELSLEGGSSLPVVDPTPENCRIAGILEADNSSQLVQYAYNSTYSADQKVTSIQFVDSIRAYVDNTFFVSYSTGKVQVDTRQFFITGTDGKVTEFHGFEFPEDTTSERFTVKYSYNAAGQLIRRTEEYDQVPGVTSFQMDYTYTGNNLIKTEAKVNNGTSLQKFIDIAYEYETTKTVRNFIYWTAVAPEIFYFQTAINAGATSVNPVKKATTIFYDYSNGRDSTAVSNFVNYTYDTKNRVISFQVTGADFAVNNMYAGKKYTFNYSCF